MVIRAGLGATTLTAAVALTNLTMMIEAGTTAGTLAALLVEILAPLLAGILDVREVEMVGVTEGGIAPGTGMTTEEGLVDLMIEKMKIDEIRAAISAPDPVDLILDPILDLTLDLTLVLTLDLTLDQTRVTKGSPPDLPPFSSNNKLHSTTATVLLSLNRRSNPSSQSTTTINSRTITLNLEAIITTTASLTHDSIHLIRPTNTALRTPHLSSSLPQLTSTQLRHLSSTVRNHLQLSTALSLLLHHSSVHQHLPSLSNTVYRSLNTAPSLQPLLLNMGHSLHLSSLLLSTELRLNQPSMVLKLLLQLNTAPKLPPRLNTGPKQPLRLNMALQQLLNLSTGPRLQLNTVLKAPPLHSMVLKAPLLHRRQQLLNMRHLQQPSTELNPPLSTEHQRQLSTATPLLHLNPLTHNVSIIVITLLNITF